VVNYKKIKQIRRKIKLNNNLEESLLGAGVEEGS